MHLRVQIPVRNERETLATVVMDALRQAERFAGTTSVVIVDDGSTDGSREIAKALAGADARIQVLDHGVHVGLGAGFRAGVADAIAEDVDVLVHCDGDGQFDPRHLDRLIAPIMDGAADLVTASRFLDVSPDPPLPLTRHAGNVAFAHLVSRLAGQRLSDVSCGFRAFSRRALRVMQLRGDFTYTHESILRCAWEGLSIIEVGVPVRERKNGTSRIARSPVLYGVQALSIIVTAWLRERALQ